MNDRKSQVQFPKTREAALRLKVEKKVIMWVVDALTEEMLVGHVAGH